MDEMIAAGYDAGWKWMLEKHFEECMQFYFHDVWSAIDWLQPLEFVDSEFLGETGERAVGVRRADKIVKAVRKDGGTAEIFIHVEAQGRKRRTFEHRMLIYWYRLADKTETHPVSLAILTDGDANWRPNHYEQSDLGCKIRLDFPMAKLLDYKGKETSLLESSNPFALVTLAHLRISEGKKGNEARLAMKVELIELLQQRGYDAEYRHSLLRFLDWIMPLPEPYNPRFREAMTQLKKEYGNKMEMLTSWEKYGLEQGLEKGLEQGREEGVILGQIRTLKRQLTRKFGELPTKFVEELENTEEQAILDSLEMQILFVNSLEEIVFEQVVDEESSNDDQS